MRAGFAILLFAFFCPFLSARADVIVSGSVSTTDQGAAPCSQSGAASGSLSLSCSSSISGTSATASASGSGNAFAGSVTDSASVVGPQFTEPGVATGSIELMLNQSYMLTGGTGPATAVFNISGFTTTAAPSCSFIFNGVTQPLCSPFAQTYSETVEYGVPFTVGLDLGVFAKASNGAPADGSFSYNFNQPGLQATPEPSSILLLMPGMAGALFAVRLRARDRLAARVNPRTGK